LDDAVLLQPPDAFGDARRRQADGTRQVRRADARVLFQQAQQLEVDGVEVAFSVSKDFQVNFLSLERTGSLTPAFSHAKRFCCLR
jgi:hypothetical protein